MAVASAGPYANHSRQITTPAPHHSIFLQAGRCSWRPTNSVKALKAVKLQYRVRTVEIVWHWNVWWCCTADIYVSLSGLLAAVAYLMRPCRPRGRTDHHDTRRTVIVSWLVSAVNLDLLWNVSHWLCSSASLQENLSSWWVCSWQAACCCCH